MRAGALMVALSLLGCGAAPDDAAVPTTEDADLADGPAPDASAPDVAPEGGIDARGARDAPDARTDASGADRASPDARRDATLDARDGSDAGRADRATMDATGEAGQGCPEGMVLVAGMVCVDRWEASLEEISMDGGVRDWSPYHSVEGRRVRAVTRPGVVPQGYISGAQAEAACRLAGKRLCALTEWLAACRGPTGTVYPYGNGYVRRRCNEGRTPHPVVQYYGTSMGVFTYERLNNPGINMQPDTVARTGAFTDCVSSWGIADLVGNLHEWIADPAGTFKGGFYVDAEINGRGCLYTTTAHAFAYHDYSTGFRCCADPR